MGYDFHITRADQWFESAQYPISRAEWAEAARRHPEIELSPTGGAGSIASEDDSFAWFTWSNGQLTTKYSQSLTAWTVRFAHELGARLVGDEEEEYFEDGSHLDREGPRRQLFVRPLQPDEAATAIQSLVERYSFDEPDFPGGVGLASTLRGFEDFAAREVETPGPVDVDELQFTYHMADSVNGYGIAVVRVIRRLASTGDGRIDGGWVQSYECELPYIWPESDPVETYAHPSHVQLAGLAGAEARAAWFDGVRRLPYLAEFTGGGDPEIRFYDCDHDRDHDGAAD